MQTKVRYTVQQKSKYKSSLYKKYGDKRHFSMRKVRNIKPKNNFYKSVEKYFMIFDQQMGGDADALTKMSKKDFKLFMWLRNRIIKHEFGV